MPQKTGVPMPVKERDTRLELNEVVRSVADFVQNIAREIKFSINEDSGDYIVTVADSHTGEIIRQIPREEMIEISQHLAEFQRSHPGLKHNGLLFSSET